MLFNHRKIRISRANLYLSALCILWYYRIAYSLRRRARICAYKSARAQLNSAEISRHHYSGSYQALLPQYVEDRLSRRASGLSVVAEPRTVSKLVGDICIAVMRCVGIALAHRLYKFLRAFCVHLALDCGYKKRAFNLASYLVFSVNIAVGFHSTLTL